MLLASCHLELRCLSSPLGWAQPIDSVGFQNFALGRGCIISFAAFKHNVGFFQLAVAIIEHLCLGNPVNQFIGSSSPLPLSFPFSLSLFSLSPLPTLSAES